MRFSKLWAAVPAAVALLVFCSAAQAEYITSNGTVYMEDPNGAVGNGGANPPLEHIQEWGLGAGQLWTNQVTSIGAPFSAGNTVRTVGSISLSQLINGTASPVWFPDADFSEAHIIFAVEGTTIAPGVASFTKGALWIAPSVTANPVGFEVVNPLSYNFDNVIAKYNLSPAGEIIPGTSVGIDPSGNVAATAAEVNVSAVTGIAGNGNGVFTFLEDVTFTLPGVNPGLGTAWGKEFLSDVVAPPGPPIAEGLAAFTDQTQDTTAETLTAAQIAELDKIGLAAGFSGAFSEGGFDPKGSTSATQTGDFSADLSSELYTIASPVPEPASVAIFGIGALGCAVAGRRRKKAALNS